MKKFAETALGILTSIGGFLEIGSMGTSIQAGTEYRFGLLWVIALGTLCLILLVEMSGRLAAVSKSTIADALRERFGINIFMFVLVGVGVSSLLVLASEISGVCLALQLATGIAFPWWAPVAGVAVWLLLWRCTFGVLEYGVSLLGLITVAFAVAAVQLHPPLRDLAAGLLPARPPHDAARYWFIAVSVLGATLTPYLFYFYSAGAIEDHWDERHLGMNRFVATVGMWFGGGLSMAILIVAAVVFEPKGVQFEHFEQGVELLMQPFGAWGFWLFVGSLAIACLGAALEIALALSYLVAQGFGWQWGKNVRPRQAARFSALYTGVVFAAALLAAVGIDPLKLTMISMALTAAILPLAVVPFLVVMNDARYMGRHVNGWIANSAVVVIIGLAFVLAVVSIPLEIAGG